MQVCDRRCPMTSDKIAGVTGQSADHAGGLASGACVYRLEAANRIVVRTMTLVKR